VRHLGVIDDIAPESFDRHQIAELVTLEVVAQLRG
jgi:hypothetical protein